MNTDKKFILLPALMIVFFWHRRLGHIRMYILSRLVKNKLIKCLHHIAFKKEKLCDA
jgi:hypothetical protein